jgi:hypothetical protein
VALCKHISCSGALQTRQSYRRFANTPVLQALCAKTSVSLMSFSLFLISYTIQKKKDNTSGNGVLLLAAHSTFIIAFKFHQRIQVFHAFSIFHLVQTKQAAKQLI